jgi:putative FmdB family regulatory protein
VPIYEYQCKKCKHRFEKIQGFSDKPLKKCPECGGPVEQLLSAPSFQFKGTGWYVTDYARSGDKGGSTKESDGGSGETTAKETSPESKAEKPKEKKKEAPSKKKG